MKSKKLYYIDKEKNFEDINLLLRKHPEIRYVSLTGIDMGGNATDEKIPVEVFLDDMQSMINSGIQTDGSSVELQGIATLNNARVDILPDLNAKWFVDYNLEHFVENAEGTETEAGTLRIPSFLIHNGQKVGSRSIIDRMEKDIELKMQQILSSNEAICNKYGFASKDIDKVVLTSATELEMWVHTPGELADLEELSTSQILKEQYWKRTRGKVRTVLEKCISVLQDYGLEPEMAHKEVGGITNQVDATGRDHRIMEQLEIDWKYATPLQAADNELLAREIIEDLCRFHGLKVSFKAKPIEGVAGNGKHVHLGIAVKLSDGRFINLFAPNDMKEDYLSEIGYGALFGLLKNYEIINPFVSNTNDAFNRLKPGFEAPVCTVTSLGGDKKAPTRNRSVLVGVIRDLNNPLATRFELRSPNPTSNTFLVIASCYQAMVDGIISVLDFNMDTKELEAELTKKYGDDSKYLDKNKEYETNYNVFVHFTEEERNKLYGKAPFTVWENIKMFKEASDKYEILERDSVFTEEIINSFITVSLEKWKNELKGRIIQDNISILRRLTKLHTIECTDLDVVNWENINFLKRKLMKDSLHEKSVFTRLREALDAKEFDLASQLQIEMNTKMTEIRQMYIKYRRNIL